MAQQESESDLTPNGIDTSNNEQASSYLHGRLLRYILLHIHQTPKSKKQLLDRLVSFTNQDTGYAKCVAENFAKQYKPEKAIWWYTNESFLHRALNKALREQDVDFLYDTRRFLVDLHQQIHKNHRNFDFKKPLYRGIKLADHDAEKLNTNVGKLIHFDQYLSTSINEDTAKAFLGDRKPGHQAILFHIDISSATIEIDSEEEPIAFIEEFSQRPNEKEVLISPSSVFRLLRIDKSPDRDTKIKIWHIFLELTNARDQELLATYQQLKKEIEIDEKYSTFETHLAKLLRRLDKPEKAIKYYEIALDELDTASTHYNQHRTVILTDLALTYISKRDYKKALDYVEKAEESAKTLAIQPYATPFRAIINAKRKIYTERYFESCASGQHPCENDLENARNCNIKLLEIHETCGIKNPIEYATVLNNFGVFNQHLGKFSQALKLFSRALEIRSQELPSYYIDLADSHRNMAYACVALGLNKTAEDCSRKSQEIIKKILPKDHQSMAYAQKIAGKAKYQLGRYDEAYSDLDEAAEILRRQEMTRADIRLSEIETLSGEALKEMKETP